MGLKRIVILSLFMSLLVVQNTYGDWQLPVEVVTGIWGQGEREFGLEHGDTSDRLPWLTAVLFDGKIVISDEVNERETVYNSDGTLFKVVSWYIWRGSEKTVSPEYSTYKYWDVQGYTTDGNIWIKIKNYLMKSPTGQLIKTSAERPAELGIVNEQSLGDKKYKVTITYPDKTYILRNGPYLRYVRDSKGYLNAMGGKWVERFDACGRLITKLKMPEDKRKVLRPAGNGFEERTQLIEEFGEPVIAPNGDVYTWKRTPETYSILKWTWTDEPAGEQIPPGSPAHFSGQVAAAGISLYWFDPPNPGCVMGYEISRSTSSGGPYAVIATLDAGKQAYYDKSALSGKKYYYKVRAFAGNEYSPYSNVVSLRMK